MLKLLKTLLNIEKKHFLIIRNTLFHLTKNINMYLRFAIG